MGITRPTGEQLRFRSATTGDHILDTYMENSEKGSRTLPDLMDDLFDSSGVFRSANFEFRFDETTDKIQFRAGNFATPNAGWTDITTFFNITGTFNASTTYNNFDLLTLTNKDVYIVHGLSSGTTFADEAAVIASANTQKLVDVSEAKDWASKTDGQVVSTDYSSKAYAVGGTGVDTTTGSAKDWAIKTSSTVGNTGEYSAKYWATSTSVTTVSSGIANINTVAAAIASVNTTAANISNVNTVAGISADVTTVANIDGNVSTVAGISANTTTVAGIASNVTTVAGVATNVTTVAGIASNVTTVANNNTNVTTVATNVADLQTVADEIDNNNLQTVANDINAVVTAANDLNEATSEIDTVANSIANVDLVGGSIANVNTVATNIANVNTTATNIANVNTVAGISANVTTVAGISADVTTAATNNANITTVAGISSNVTTVAGISANVTTVANISADVTTAATNVTAFNNTYLGAQSSAPTQDPDGSALDLGDLYFDTVADVLKVRASGGWINAGSAVNGTANRFTFTATSGQTTFTGADANGETLAYDSGYMDIYMNGVKLAAGDYTASNGTSVVIAAAAAGDTLEMIAYGTFNLANVAINDLTDVNTTGLANDSILAYNSSNSRFEPTATPTFSSITVSGNVDGRDISVDGTKLDTIETNADVTDTTNVTAAGALMDSELTDITAIKALDQGVATTDKPTFNGINSTEALPTVRPSLLLDFANSKTLDPRITFARGSTATYWDGKTTTKAEENLQPYSQDLGSWTNGSGATVTTDAGVAPDGTTTADRIYAASGWYRGNVFSLVAGETYTMSIYLKSNSGSNEQLVLFRENNLASSTLTATTSWQRFTYTFTVSSSAASDYGLWSGSPTLGGVDVLAWGMQLEQRSSATAYTPTTSTPIVKYQPTLQTAASGEARFDHDPVTGESKGLLIEGARTNILTESQNIGLAGGWAYNQFNIYQNYAIAPDGTKTAHLFSPDTIPTTHYIRHNFSSTTGTFSVYAKAGGTNTFMFLIGSSVNEGLKVNLDTGTVISTHGGVTDYGVEYVGNGWYRCWAYAPSASTSAYMYVPDSGGTQTGDGFNGVYLWGAQFEAGAFPTSYIPTSGSTVTRSADLASLTGTSFTEFYNPTEGTLFTDAITSQSSTSYMFYISDGTYTNRIGTYQNGNGYARFLVRSNGSTYADTLGTTAYSRGDSMRFAAAYAANDVAAVDNGSTAQTDNGVNVPFSTDEAYIGADAAGSVSNAVHLKKLAYYPKRLSNATLQAMTEA